MIASIEGVVTEIAENHLVINLNGLGFIVFVSPRLLKATELHKTIGLSTYLVVREDSLTLYGFETNEEREMFTHLLSVSGVGPRSAMALVSSISIDNIKKSIILENPDLLNGVSGIGKKTAQSIVLHLHGKIKGESSGGAAKISDVDADVISALTGLGYSLIEAQAAIQLIPNDAPEDLESRVKLALQSFS